ncbi:Voltage-dependent T-type calcium channel subunit alpha-1H, partial [Symbiodinium microadriaticum]
DTWLQSQAALQGLGSLDPNAGESGRAFEMRGEGLRAMVTQATENLENRRDSRVVPNPEIHRLLEKIKEQDTASQMNSPAIEKGIWPKFRLQCQRLVGAVWFECFISVAIVLNSALMGVESQLALNGQELSFAGAAEIVFLIIYTAEIVVRLIAQQWACWRDWWFLFDFSLVLCAIAEQLVFASTGESADTIMILRLLRLIRLVRSFRMIKQIRSVWRLVYGLVTCGETMCSTFALLGLVIYVFGVLGVEVIAGNAELLSNSKTASIITNHFSSLGMTMATLTQFVTMDSIAAVYTPLTLEQPLLLFYFLPLGAIVSIALMNLITAVLVEGALESARQDREEERKMDSITTKQMVPQIVAIFDQIDLDGDGEIGIEEMLEFDKPSRGGAAGINRRILDRASVDSMEELFKVLDVDNSGRVSRMEIMKMLRSLRESVGDLQGELRKLQSPPKLRGISLR